MRANIAQGVYRFFITDDNFARNRNWEPIFDRLIEMREKEGLKLHFLIQVDTLCHRIPNFIEKAARAGCSRAYIGLENINPDNLLAVKKKQNRVHEYRQLFLEFRKHKVITYAGYILGFPNDTPERIFRDIKTVQDELPVDVLEFFILTPLPGSEDHQKNYKAGVWMDPDMNKYDLEHVTAHHPTMSDAEWQELYRKAFDIYYSPEHIERMFRRAKASGMKPIRLLNHVLQFYFIFKQEKVHPLQGGFFRRKIRTQRRSGLPRENPLIFYPRRVWEVAETHGKLIAYYWFLHRLRKKVERDATPYHDPALIMPEPEKSAAEAPARNGGGGVNMPCAVRFLPWQNGGSRTAASIVRRMLRSVLLVTLPAAYPAAAEMFGPDYRPCGDRPNTLAIVECVQAKTKAWDQRLNAAYQALQTRIDPTQRQPLLTAQRLWVQCRDANCGFYGAQEGSIRQVQAAECTRAMTEDRARELQRAMKFD